MPSPFFVIATQNPIEQEGTYPLPEAQLDRFMFNIKVDYPSFEEEKRILATTTKDEPAELTKVLSCQGDRQHAEAGAQRAGRRLRDRLRHPAGAGHPAQDPIGAGLRAQDGGLGRGPRAGQLPDPGGKAMAAMDGRFSVAIDDIKKVAIPVLRHRISTNFQAQAEGQDQRGRHPAAAGRKRRAGVAKYERRQR